MNVSDFLTWHEKHYLEDRLVRGLLCIDDRELTREEMEYALTIEGLRESAMRMMTAHDETFRDLRIESE